MKSANQARKEQMLKRQERRRNKIPLAKRLSDYEISVSFLSDESQDEVISLLRRTGNLLHDKFREYHYGTLTEALNAIGELDIISMRHPIIVMGYEYEFLPAFLATSNIIHEKMLIDPFIVSSDGVIFIEIDKQAGAIIEFHGLSRQSSADLVLLGNASKPNMPAS